MQKMLGVRFRHNNYALAIKRRRGGGGTAMFALSVKAAWDLGIRDRSSQKKPLEQKHAWSIRVRLEISRSRRDFVIFNLAIDSKLRACDLVRLRLDDICSGGKVRYRAKVVQRPVQFDITEQSGSCVEAWLPMLRITDSRHLFPSRLHIRPTYPPASIVGRCTAGFKVSA